MRGPWLRGLAELAAVGWVVSAIVVLEAVYLRIAGQPHTYTASVAALFVGLSALATWAARR